MFRLDYLRFLPIISDYAIYDELGLISSYLDWRALCYGLINFVAPEVASASAGVRLGVRASKGMNKSSF